MTRSGAALVDEFTARLRPLEVELARAWWELNTNASDEAEQRRQEVELAVRDVLSDATAYDAVAAAQGDDNPLVARQLRLLWAAMTPNQLDEATRARLVALETQVEGVYARHRGDIDGERVSDNRIAEILTTSDDIGLRHQAWEASKSVGAAVAGDLRDLVRLRNEIARTLGFDDHYTLALTLNELDEDQLFATLDDLERETREPFARWKAELDAERAARFGCAVDELRPWHYDDVFFQEPPRSPDLDLDSQFAGTDLTDLTVRTYDGIGIDIRPAVKGSDLDPREGKTQHAFCIDIDRAGDVRVLANVAGNERWMGTMLHEFGHAAYDLGIDPSLPFLLHEPAHMLATEAVAMLFGRLVRDGTWLGSVAGVAGDGTVERAAEAQRGAMLVFVRWVLVMTHFERGLYRQPDADHDARWWDLVERFQLVRRPDGRSAPDWAAKIHIAVAPVYYQNYLYGEVMASQLSRTIDDRFGALVNRPEAGGYLVDEVFKPGASLRWDHLVEQATGEPLTARHFIDQFAR